MLRLFQWLCKYEEINWKVTAAHVTSRALLISQGIDIQQATSGVGVYFLPSSPSAAFSCTSPTGEIQDSAKLPSEGFFLERKSRTSVLRKEELH